MRRLEHVGLAVEDMDSALRICEMVFGRKPYKVEEVSSEGVRTVFLEAGSVKLELLEALGSESPVSRFIERRGQGLHHLAFEVDHLDEEVLRLADLGFTVLGEPRSGADGKRIVFLHPRDTSGVLVELCQQHSFPEVLGTESDRAIILVSEMKASDPLAHALGRHARIVRGPARAGGENAERPLDAPPKASSIAGAVAVDPSGDWLDGIDEDTPVVLIGAEGLTSSHARMLRIGIDSPGDVVLPGHLWTRLPDPWGLIADLAAGHLLPS